MQVQPHNQVSSIPISQPSRLYGPIGQPDEAAGAFPCSAHLEELFLQGGSQAIEDQKAEDKDIAET